MRQVVPRIDSEVGRPGKLQVMRLGMSPSLIRTQIHQIELLLLEGQFDDESRKDFYSQFAFLNLLDKFVITFAELLDG